ncbi:MAG: hypothetical protein IJ218_04965 [Alphaproteobacteria bacterium]|nr:hypothetical protein [Alphaproteobacteria bacterium]
MVKSKPNTKSNTSSNSSSSKSESTASWKIAVVDINSIVGASQDVATLRQNHAVRSQELSQWLQLAQNEVNNQTDQQEKQNLFQKYNAEFAQRRNVVNQLYQQELAVVDQSITKTIMDEAHKLGYNMVLAKNVVVCGGDDITEEIRKLIK